MDKCQLGGSSPDVFFCGQKRSRWGSAGYNVYAECLSCLSFQVSPLLWYSVFTNVQHKTPGLEFLKNSKRISKRTVRVIWINSPSSLYVQIVSLMSQSLSGIENERNYISGPACIHLQVTMYRGHRIVTCNILRGPPFNLQGAGVVFFADKLPTLTLLGGTLQISNFITCLYRTVLEVNYIFHAGSVRIFYF